MLYSWAEFLAATKGTLSGWLSLGRIFLPVTRSEATDVNLFVKRRCYDESFKALGAIFFGAHDDSKPRELGALSANLQLAEDGRHAFELYASDLDELVRHF